MSNCFQNYIYEIKDGKVCIKACISQATAVEVPSEIDGYPVTEIGSYAFSESGGKRIEDVVKLDFTTSSIEFSIESSIEEIILPCTIERIGRYAFYNCRNLKRIQFYNTLKDLGAGAFTGCHKVREIDVTFIGNEKSCLREFLLDLPEEQTLFYHSEDGEAKLVFPEFFEEAVENTPARILETHTHGSGMMYRNCFVQRELQFHLYDERFEWAKGCEFKETLFHLVFSRLLYPYRLSEKAEKKYQGFLKVHFEECAKWAANQKLEKEIHYLTAHCVEHIEELEILIQEVNKQNEAGMLSFLMDYKHQNFKTKRKIFEL